MVANIFRYRDYSSIDSRIEGLNEQSERRWGKMTLPQMLEHCAIQLKLALGIITAPGTEGSFIFRTPFGRLLSLYTIRWPKGFPTPAIMNMYGNGLPVPDFAAGKEQLLLLLQQVLQAEELKAHLFYGKINKKD